MSSLSAAGTGALSQLDANREATATVAADSDALLGLTSPRSNVFVDTTGGKVSLIIGNVDNGTGETANGVNTGAQTALDNILSITNQTSTRQAVGFEIVSETTGPEFTAEFYTGSASAPDVRSSVTTHTGGDTAFRLRPGESSESINEPVGLLIETGNFTSAFEGDGKLIRISTRILATDV